MKTLSQLSPTPLWLFFEKICSIPHPSHHEDNLAIYILDWAQGKGFFATRDNTGNILIRKPATSGYEAVQPAILQAHLDMVPQKNSDTQHDFIKEGIQPYIDGEWVKARGTTLGADNGIGLASTLAVLDATDLAHGPLEVFLTMTEETGMEGALGLKANWLTGKVLINTDSEQDGEACIGCAGGADVMIHYSLIREKLPSNHKLLRLHLKGLQGGHSGVDIHLGLGNANKLLARFLFKYSSEFNLRLIQIEGGSLRNAIPREASALVAVPQQLYKAFKTITQEYQTLLCKELAEVEAHLSFEMSDAVTEKMPLSLSCQIQLLSLLNALPNGVVRMSCSVEGVVETSLNVGVITHSDTEVEILCLIRSLIDSGKEYVVEMLHSIATLAGAKIVVDSGYPGWEPNPSSEVTHILTSVYQKLFNKPMHLNVIHAGLECGLFKRTYPELDMISIGPTIRGAHSPDERVEIASVERYWQLLLELLKSLPKRT